MSIPVMRPVEERDFDEIHALAQLTGGGMTNLPMDKKALRSRIDFTLESFAKELSEPNGEVYMLVLEIDGKVMGTAAIFSAIGLQSGFVNYRINTIFHFSEQLGKQVSRRLLVPTHDFTGCAEVGSLFISPEARGGGHGKLMARSRYLFMAQSPEIIAKEVCAELRGWRGPDGEQPFWEAVGRHFFDMDFEAADQHNSIAGNQFIADLMPIYPLYLALLPDDARNCIGKPHENAQPAYNMLLNEGFEYRGYVDIFDAGPVVNAPVNNIRAIKDSTLHEVKIQDNTPGDETPGTNVLIASGEGKNFRCIRAAKITENEDVIISAKQALALNVEQGVKVRVTPW